MRSRPLRRPRRWLRWARPKPRQTERHRPRKCNSAAIRARVSKLVLLGICFAPFASLPVALTALAAVVTAKRVLVLVVVAAGVVLAHRVLRLVLLVPRLLGLLLLGDERLPRLLSELERLVERVGHDQVVEDGAVVDDPQLVPDVCNVVVRAELRVRVVLCVRDLARRPLALVCRVGDALGGPRALVLGVGHARRLPLAVVLVVPVVGLGRLRINNLLRDVVIAVGLVVVGVVDHLLVNPVRRLGHRRVLNLLGRQQVELVDEVAAPLALAVDQHLERAVGEEVEGVDVRELVALARHLLADQVVLLRVPQDEVRALRVPANVRAEHHVVYVLALAAV
mmetsp:Transcript_1005/g.3206  ORF Transcript_1005/g.3206 Transcript_1005/m.3206 type:complete len:338 (-) Transcript_1005:359-1372(-)